MAHQTDRHKRGYSGSGAGGEEGKSQEEKTRGLRWVKVGGNAANRSAAAAEVWLFECCFASRLEALSVGHN